MEITESIKSFPNSADKPPSTLGDLLAHPFEEPKGPSLFRKQMSLIAPGLASILLFGMAVFGFIFPQTRQIIMEKKLETIRELTHTAWSVLASYENQVQAGLLDRTEAEARAISRLRIMRYGPQSTDYFWINNLHPVLIMHPYQSELVGKDMTAYADPTGKKIFLEFVKIASEKGEGFTSYLWQWKDDATRIEPKRSYVKLFQPWGWIVGTGLYINDVQEEIEQLRRRFLYIGAGVFLAFIALAGYMTFRGIVLEKEREKLQRQLVSMASTDALTGACNRRYFWDMANKEFERCKRYKNPISLLMMDIDHFKKINDTYGHPAGDEVLKDLCTYCMDHLRKTDLFARIGGEEFCVLLVETDIDQAQIIANRLREGLANLPTIIDRQKIRYTVSMGVTDARMEDPSVEKILSRADIALYKSKQSGRNCVSIA